MQVIILRRLGRSIVDLSPSNQSPAITNVICAEQEKHETATITVMHESTESLAAVSIVGSTDSIIPLSMETVSNTTAKPRRRAVMLCCLPLMIRYTSKLTLQILIFYLFKGLFLGVYYIFKFQAKQKYFILV